MPTPTSPFGGNELEDDISWTGFADLVARSLPFVSRDDLKPSTPLQVISGGDRLRRAMVLAVIYDLGMKLPHELLGTIETLGEAHHWCTQRRHADLPLMSSKSSSVMGLSLRVPVPEDVQALYSGLVDPRSSFRGRYRGTSPTPRQVSDDLFDGTTFLQFVVERTETKQVLGLVQAYQARIDAGTCYFAVHRTTSESDSVSELTFGLYMFVEYLFRTFPFRKLYAEVPGFNWASFSGGEDEFFVVQGVLDDHDYFDGQYWPLRILAITRARWGEIASRWGPVLR